MTDKSIEIGLIEVVIDTAKMLRGRGIELTPVNVVALKRLAESEDVDWLLEQAYNSDQEITLINAERREKIKSRFLNLVREENPNHPFLGGKGVGGDQQAGQEGKGD